MSTVVFNILFMFFRSLKENEVKIDVVDKKKQLPSADTTEANNLLMSQYLAFAIPMGVSFQITVSCYPVYLDQGHEMMKRLLFVIAIRFIITNFLIWVSWKRGPACWIKIAPTLMYLLTLTNYILIPLASLAWFAMHYQRIRESVYGIYMVTVLFIWIAQIAFYLFIIKPYIYFNAMAYIASRKIANEKKDRA